MTEVVIFQLRGTPRNVHLEAHPAALPLSKIEHHLLVSSRIPLTTHSAEGEEKLGSLGYMRPLAPGESHDKMSINEFHKPSCCRNVAGTMAAKS